VCDQPAGELVVLSLAMVILTFQSVRSAASTLLSTPFLRSSLIMSFNTPMNVVDGAMTGKRVLSPSTKHQKFVSVILDVVLGGVVERVREGLRCGDGPLLKTAIGSFRVMRAEKRLLFFFQLNHFDLDINPLHPR
jgi:hypothetical protein